MTRLPAILRPNRLEITGSVFLAIAMGVIGGGVAASRVLGPLLGRFPSYCLGPESVKPADCDHFVGRINDYENVLSNIGPAAIAITVALPLIAAIVLGLALTARELEQQTTVFAWSLAPSRRRWLLSRLGPLLLVVAAMCLVAGALADAIFGLQSTVDPWRSLDGLGTRGPPVAGMGALAMGVTLFVGSLLGRQLPALLAAVALTASASALASGVTDRWLDQESLIAPSDQLSEGDRFVAMLFLTPEGEAIGWEEAERRYGTPIYEVDTQQLGLTQVFRYVPGERYPTAVARLTAIQLLVGAIGIGLALVVVQRRRPWA